MGHGLGLWTHGFPISPKLDPPRDPQTGRPITKEKPPLGFLAMALKQDVRSSHNRDQEADRAVVKDVVGSGEPHDGQSLTAPAFASPHIAEGCAR